MNFKGKFNYLGTVDIRELIQLINQLTDDEWTEESWRQERYKVHQYTQTISLLFDLDFRHENPTKHKHFDQFENSLIPILEKIKQFYVNSTQEQNTSPEQGYAIRINMVRLMPNGEIIAHNDKNHSLSHSHRIHLPIITNDKVLFTVDNETISMKAGELIEINNRRIHHVRNNSSQIRTHIIIDWVIPGQRCCCAKTHFPDDICSAEKCHQFNFSPILCQCYDNNR